MINIISNDIIKIEIYIEKVLRNYNISGLSRCSVGITDNKEIRIALYYTDLKKGKIIQKRVKQLLKEAFNLNDIKLERCYKSTTTFVEQDHFYEILYNVPENIYQMIEILSKIN